MIELEYKNTVMGVLKSFGWSAAAHEDKIVNFIPDTSFGFKGTDGWIEFKYVQRLPKTLGSIPHYTYGQQEWLIERGTKGSGRCYLWLGTPDTNLVWHWSNLSYARDLPIAESIKYAQQEASIEGMCRAMSSIVAVKDSWCGRAVGGAK